MLHGLMSPLHNHLCTGICRRDLKRDSARFRRRSERRSLHRVLVDEDAADETVIASHNRETVNRWCYD